MHFDDLTVKKAVLDKNMKIVKLYLNGETRQDEEHYAVSLSGIKDISGNVMSDRDITVVQRAF